MTILRTLALSGLFMALATAQTTKQTFKIIYAATDQDANEIFTSVRTIADVKGAMANPREFNAEGAADQMRTTEWLLRQLDLPPGASGKDETLRNIADTRGEDTARVFFLSPELTVQEFNEVMTAVRTITDIRRVFGHSSHRAVIVRSTEEAVNAADWLLGEMMRDSSSGDLIYPRRPDRPNVEDNHIRILRYPRAKTTQDFNEAMTMVRTLTDTRRVFGYFGKREIVLRGTREELAAAEWLLSQLDRDLPSSAPQVSGEFPAPYQVAANQPKEVLRLFYFTGADTDQTLVARATAIKEQAGVRRIFYTANPRVLAVGGTSEQLAKIELIARQ